MRRLRFPATFYRATLFPAIFSSTLAFGIPEKPVRIAQGIPRFFIDDWLVDNRFAIKYKKEAVTHVAHPPTKHPGNPLYTGDSGYVTVHRDRDTGLFRAWTQVHDLAGKPGAEKSTYAIAYLESRDGLNWDAPNFEKFEWKGVKGNNIVIRGPKNARVSGPQILTTLPESERRGYRYLMALRVGAAGKDYDGIRIAGSQDGINWDLDIGPRLQHLHSDTVNSLIYDEVENRYLMTCRAKDRYRRFSGSILDTGASRRVSIMSSPGLWTEWKDHPHSILIPDEIDAETHHNFFYGMPLHRYAGINWGFLWNFRMNDPIHTELTTNRGGSVWKRSPKRVPLIPLGAEGEWDDGMTFGSGPWIEVDDEWWFYYTGHDGGHDSKDRRAAIGLATCKKERLVSLRGPQNGGGVVITRTIVWPGGELYLNTSPVDPEADSSVTVRVSEPNRDILPGYDHADCRQINSDAVRHKVEWNNGNSMDDLTGRTVRLEIFLLNADLFTFIATE